MTRKNILLSDDAERAWEEIQARHQRALGVRMTLSLSEFVSHLLVRSMDDQKQILKTPTETMLQFNEFNSGETH